MSKKVKYIFFIIGIIMIFIGLPYLMGYTTNNLNKSFLYLGPVIAVIFAPIPEKSKK